MNFNFRYDSRYASKYKQNMQETIEYILSQEYGSILPLEKLGKMLGYNIEDQEEKLKFKQSMSRVRNFIIDYGYVLKSMGTLGFYILKPQQISGFCYHTYILKTTKLLDKSDRVLRHIDMAKLSEGRKEEKEAIHELNTEINKDINSLIDNSRYISRKEYYDGLED